MDRPDLADRTLKEMAKAGEDSAAAKLVGALGSVAGGSYEEAYLTDDIALIYIFRFMVNLLRHFARKVDVKMFGFGSFLIDFFSNDIHLRSIIKCSSIFLLIGSISIYNGDTQSA